MTDQEIPGLEEAGLLLIVGIDAREAESAFRGLAGGDPTFWRYRIRVASGDTRFDGLRPSRVIVCQRASRHPNWAMVEAGLKRIAAVTMAEIEYL